MAFDASKVDWGSLSQTTGGEIDQPLDDNLSFTMSEAVKIDPDKHSRSMDLSKKSGVPALSITPNLESIEKEVKVNEFDFSSLRTNSPKTANYIVSPDNAVIAQDDIPVMESIESLLNFDVTDLNRSVTEFGKETTAYGEDIGAGFERGQLTVESSDIGRSRMYDAWTGKADTTDEKLSRLSEIEGKLQTHVDDYGFFAGAPIAAAEQLPIMGEILGTGLGYAAVGGAAGLVAGAVTGPGAIATGIGGAKIAGRVGVAKAAFDLESGLAFNEYSGFTGANGELIDQKLVAGASMVVGGINAALEFVSLVALGRTVTPIMRSTIRSKVKQALGTESGRQVLTRMMGRYAKAIAAETVTEGMQEFVTVIGGELSKYINEDSFSELYLAEALDNIFSEKTAERVGEGMKKAAQASMVLSSPGTIASIAVENNRRKALAENDQKKIDNLNQSFSDSNLKGRNKDKFREFVEQADGENNTTVFMDGSQVSLYLQDISLEEIEADQALSLLASQAKEAAALGTDVQIPVADFATDIAGTEHYDALRESMTMSEDGVSPFRQIQIDEDNRTYIQALMDDMKESSTRNTEHGEVLEQVKNQLIDTGRLSPQEASVAAQVVPAWADAKARKTGKSIKEVYEESGLVIKGALTGERARLEAEKALQQAKDSGYKGDVVTEASEYKQAVDKGLDMSQEARMQRAFEQGYDTNTTFYHGTPDSREIWKGGFADPFASMNPTEKAAPFFFSTDKRVADTYADDSRAFDFQNAEPETIAVRLKIVNPKTINWGGRSFRGREAGKPFALTEAIDLAREEGHDGVIINNIKDTYDAKGLSGNVTVVFDAAQIRSVDAAFDPDFKESANLLAQRDEKQEPRGYYEPENTLIRLTETSNLSTFLHEFAHFMYEMELKGDADSIKSIHSWHKRNSKAVAKEAKNDVSEVDVYEFLDNGTTGDKTKDEAVRRAAHEQFARGFETYLMEGKAPSVELRSAFRTFARWLAQVYENLKGNLNVKLDDEAREFFDRLIATEEQIAEAQGRARVAPLFTDATMAGMSEEAFVKYQNDQTKSTDKQVETLRDKIIEQLTNKTKKWWKEERDDLVQEEMADLKRDRVHSTRDRLKSKKSTKAVEGEIEALDADSKAIEKRIKEIKKENDTIGQFISKKGGLNREEMAAHGIDKEEFKKKGKVFGKPLFPKSGGMTAEDVAELLNRENVDGGNLTASNALDLISQMIAGDNKYIDPDAGGELTLLEDDSTKAITARDDLTADLEFINIKLDRAAVKELVGEQKVSEKGKVSEVIPKSLSGMTVTGEKGIDPETAAAMFGYGSAEKMLSEIMNAPKIGDVALENAERRMVQRHGDILNDGTIQREADEAVQDESRAELMLKELKVLSKNTSIPKVDKKVIKEQAKDRIGRLTFREIFPAKYRRAEIKAAQDAAKLHAKGDKEGAARAKARQIVNFYLSSEATKAKADTMKIVDNMSRYRKKTVIEAIQKAGNGYWEQISNILTRFEFRKGSTLKEVDAINLWMMERIDNDGDELNLTEEVVNQSYVRHWKNVPFDKLKGIDSSVKNLEHVAKYSNKITLLKEQVEFGDLRNDVISTLDELKTVYEAQRTTGKEPTGYDSLDKLRNTGKAAGRWGREGMAKMTKIPMLASWMDGGERTGLMSSLLDKPLVDANDKKHQMWQETVVPLLDAMGDRSKEDSKRMVKRLHIPEIETEAWDGYLYGFQVLSVALNSGNDGNLRKMLLGEGWANPDIESEISINNPKLQAVLKHMSETDWILVEKIWKAMDSLYPMLNKITEKKAGVTLQRVEPVKVETEYGTFSGGYYVLEYDPDRSEDAARFKEKREAQMDSMFSTLGSMQQSVTAGSTHERTKYSAPILFDLNVVTNHFQEVIHYITHHDAVRQINKIISDPQIKAKMKEKIGKEEFSKLRPWLNDIAKDGRMPESQAFGASMFRRLRFGTTYAYLGYKMSTILIQPLGLLTSTTEIGSKSMLYGLRRMIDTMPMGDNKAGWTGRDFALANSKVLRHRIKTFDREFANAQKSLEGKSGKMDTARLWSMMGIGYVQLYLVDMPTWHGAYQKTLDSNGGNHDDAVQNADFVVRMTQGSGEISDTAEFLRMKNEGMKLFFAFMTYFSALWNMERDIVRNTAYGKFSPTETAAKMFWLFVAMTIGEMLIRGELEPKKDEDDEEYAKRLFNKTATAPMASVPYLRDVANGFTSGFGHNSSPALQMASKGVDAITGIANKVVTGEDISKHQAKSAFIFLGALFNIPGTSQTWATGDHLYQVINEGEEFTIREGWSGPKRD